MLQNKYYLIGNKTDKERVSFQFFHSSTFVSKLFSC